MCVVVFSFALLFSVRRTSCFDYVAGQESCSAAAAEATAAAAAASAIQREERSRVLRERQNEERQRKLEELKQQVRLVCLSHTFNCASQGHLRPTPTALPRVQCLKYLSPALFSFVSRPFRPSVRPGVGDTKVPRTTRRGAPSTNGGAAPARPGAPHPGRRAQEGHPGSGARAAGGDAAAQ